MEVMVLAAALPQHHVEKMRATAMVIPIVLVISNVEMTIVTILLSLGGRIAAMILQKVNLHFRIFRQILSIFLFTGSPQSTEQFTPSPRVTRIHVTRFPLAR